MRMMIQQWWSLVQHLDWHVQPPDVSTTSVHGDDRCKIENAQERQRQLLFALLEEASQVAFKCESRDKAWPGPALAAFRAKMDAVFGPPFVAHLPADMAQWVREGE
jgi:hypothetical protein